LIARPLLMKANLPMTTWEYIILHVAVLIRIRPTSYHKYSHLQLVFGQQPHISHLRIFRCVIYVPISPPKRTMMGPQRRLEIYVGYDSLSIILNYLILTLLNGFITNRYLDPPLLILENENKVTHLYLKRMLSWCNL